MTRNTRDAKWAAAAAVPGTPENVVSQLARDCGDIETLCDRGSDQLDFHDLSVLTLRDLLLRAYHAGQHDAKK